MVTLKTLHTLCQDVTKDYSVDTYSQAFLFMDSWNVALVSTLGKKSGTHANTHVVFPALSHIVIFLLIGKTSDICLLGDDPLKEPILRVLPETAMTNSVSRWVCRFSYVMVDHLASLYRPSWIKIYGQEFHRASFIHSGWQVDDDLPEFSKIVDILVILGAAMLYVKLYETEGINNHLSAYSIISTHKTTIIHIPNLDNREVYHAHTYTADRRLYIAMRAHVPKI